MTTAPKIVCYWGPEGSGKTRKAKAECAGEVFYMRRPTTGDWWHGYTGQTHVIIDKVDTGYIPMNMLCDLLDGSSARVEVKMLAMTFQATHVWLLATTHPATWMPGSNHKAHAYMLNRITHHGVLEQCFSEQGSSDA